MKDLLKGKSGWAINATVAIVLLSTFFIPVRTKNWLWTIFFFVYGIVHLQKHEKISRRLTGAGLIAISIFALLNTLFIINIPWIYILISILAVTVLSSIIEYLARKLNS